MAKGITDAEKLKLMVEEFSNHCNVYLDFSKNKFPELFPGHNLLKRVLWSLHCSNEDSLKSINMIIKEGDLLSSITICRSMFESIIDMGLLSNKDDKEANKYLGFSTIERYKVLSNIINFPNQRVDINLLKKMKGEIKDYLSIYYPHKLKGKEFYPNKLPQNWYDRNMLDKAKDVDKKYSNPNAKVFEYYYWMIYRAGSFATHRNAAAFDLCHTFKKSETKMAILLREDTFITTIINSLKLFLISLGILNDNLDKDKKIYEYVNIELNLLDEKFNKFYL